MTPVIEYLLTLNSSTFQLCTLNSFQIVISSIPPLRVVKFSVSPGEAYAYILYEVSFGERIVPQSLGTKLFHSGVKLFDAIVSGAFIINPMAMFAIVTTPNTMDIEVSNYRLLNNYFEMTTFQLVIDNHEKYDTVIDALRRLETSVKLETTLSELVRAQGGGS